MNQKRVEGCKKNLKNSQHLLLNQEARSVSFSPHFVIFAVTTAKVEKGKSFCRKICPFFVTTTVKLNKMDRFF
jgi:hypothetical protein